MGAPATVSPSRSYKPSPQNNTGAASTGLPSFGYNSPPAGPLAGRSCMSMPAHLGRRIRLLRRCEAGQSLIEYAIVIALIAVGLIAVLSLLRSAAGGVLNGTAATVSRQASSSGYGESGRSPSRGCWALPVLAIVPVAAVTVPAPGPNGESP